MNRVAKVAIILAAALPLAAAASPLPFVEDVQCGVTEPVCVMVAPDGSGGGLAQARTMDGQIVDASIDVQIWLIDEFGPLYPLGGFPAEDIGLQAHVCATMGCGQPYVMIADADTDPDGWTRFSAAPRAGGWSQDLLDIWLVGDPASLIGADIPPLPIWFNSPDLSGDLVVDLTDMTLFTQDLGSGEAVFRSDLVWDGVLNLSDIAVFTQHLGASCP